MVEDAWVPLAVDDLRLPERCLDDRVVLVTGASSGLGRAAATLLAAHGAVVILLGSSERRLRSVYDEIIAAGNAEPHLCAFDLARAGGEQYDALHELLRTRIGRLDGLVLNAARLGALSPIEHLDPVEWLTTLHVNATAPFLLTRALLPLLCGSTGATVLVSADATQQRPRAYWGAYAAAKSALAAFAAVLADEFGPARGLRVTTLAFDPLATPLRRAAYPAEAPTRWPPPERVAPAFVHALATERWDLHGKTLHVTVAKRDTLNSLATNSAPILDGGLP